MSVITIPEGHQAVMPYLIINQAAQFAAFAQTVFNAHTRIKHMRDENSIMHAEVDLNGSTIMFCDSTDQWHAQPASLFVYVANADETYQKALKEGAETIMELSNQDYGRTCGVKDASGNTWWITSLPA